MSPETDPATMTRSELVRKAHQLGMHHLEHLHIEELVEAVTENSQRAAAGLQPKPAQPSQSA